MRRFHHVGVITDERQPGEIYVAETKVHVTNPADHPYRVEYLRFEQPVTANIVTPDFELNCDSMTLSVRGQSVDVTATEFRLLHYLASHPGKVYSRDQVLDAVWRDMSFVTPRSVDVYIRRLREKVEPNPEQPIYLKTVRGAGYKFEAAK